MLEVGVQAPPDPTAVSFDPHEQAFTTPGILAEALSPKPGSTTASAKWIPLFPQRAGPRYLDPRHAVLRASERLVAEAGDGELLVIVARGAVQLAGAADRRLRTFSALLLDPHTAVELHAVDAPTLLIGIEARASSSQPL